MVRVKGGTVQTRRHKKVLRKAKGYRGLGSKIYKIAKEKVMLAGRHAYRHRREKKRVMRRLWIARLNAACRMRGLKYSEFIGKMHEKGIMLDRKVLSELAIKEPKAFDAVVDALK